MEKKMRTVAEVAEMYAVNVQTVYAWIREGQLKAIRVGKRIIRITQEALEEFENAKIF